MLTLYKRTKNSNGKWHAEKVREGRGIKTSSITGPFFVRPWNGGVQKRTPLHSSTFAEARIEADALETTLAAQSKGLSVAELSGLQNSNRLPIKAIIETYLSQKKSKSKKTLQQYALALNEFRDSLGRIRFLDEITVDVLRKYKDDLIGKGYAGKTVDTRVNVVYFMLKKNGVEARIPRDEMPTVETEDAVPYNEDDLRKMFAVMNDEEEIRYRFFLGSAARDREVKFAAWADINFDKRTFTVRSKPEMGFTVKNHESRSVALPKSLIDLLRARRKAHPTDRWIFEEKGAPGNHFLRKLKQIAKRAGINCGQCKATISKWRRGQKHMINVSCATGPHCSHIYLHRFRKTAATRWMESGVPIRTIQVFLGHKNLEVTARYLGVTDSKELRGKIDAAYGD